VDQNAEVSEPVRKDFFRLKLVVVGILLVGVGVAGGYGLGSQIKVREQVRVSETGPTPTLIQAVTGGLKNVTYTLLENCNYYPLSKNCPAYCQGDQCLFSYQSDMMAGYATVSAYYDEKVQFTVDDEMYPEDKGKEFACDFIVVTGGNEKAVEYLAQKGQKVGTGGMIRTVLQDTRTGLDKEVLIKKLKAASSEKPLTLGVVFESLPATSAMGCLGYFDVVWAE